MINIKDTILQDFHLKDEDVLNIYSYGSRVYGTNNAKSDHDFIVLTKNGTQDRDSMDSSTHNINVSIYSQNSFEDLLKRHKIFILECIFLPPQLIIKNTLDIPFRLDKQILRNSISEKASHSWVKSKKKFEVEADRNVYIAKKSLFHSLRIIDFGIQIAKHNKIMDYSSCNTLWEDIYTDPSEEWDSYKNKYHELFNSSLTEFRKLAPK